MGESCVTAELKSILDAADKPLAVIEIGTAYGEHLSQLSECSNLLEMISVDPMYDWVPDVGPNDAFDVSLVDQIKVDSWHKNRGDLPIKLIIAKSHDAAVNGLITHTGFDILLIDGCHHPAEAVEADYWDYVPYLASIHTVIFDDINHGDPGTAARNIENKLREAGHSVESSEVAGGRILILRVNQLAST